MLTLLLELLGELLVQLLVELLAFFLPELLTSWRKQAAPAWLKAISYGFCGLVCGAVSIYFLPKLLIAPAYALANLLLTPLLMGMLFVVLSKVRADDHDWLQKARFIQGFLFALGFALIRYLLL